MAWDKFKVKNPQVRKALDDVFTGEVRVTEIDAASLKLNGTAVSPDTAADVEVVDAGTYYSGDNAEAVLQEVGASIAAIESAIGDTLTNDSLTLPEASSAPVNAVAAVGTLDVTGVAIDGETLTVGDDTYEFAADAAQTVTSGNIAVDITTHTTASEGELTIDTQPTSGKELVIGTKTYTWVPDGTANADGEISVGTDLATAQAAIVAAINGTDSVNTAHTQVSASAFAINVCTVTALVGGTDGDTIATTTDESAGTNGWDAANLGTATAGADCTAANAITALVAAQVASGTEAVTFADAAGDTMTATSDVSGTIGNAIAFATDMANATVDDTELGGTVAGVDGTVGSQWEIFADASYLYVAIDDNTVADANWRRITLGAAY